ncbi:MAG TPA: RusA family crossover junction endodeoxyribonuclease [bacterium]|nr:RusA family crossover junction endodeoxyribonuclease [bacterium]
MSDDLFITGMEMPGEGVYDYHYTIGGIPVAQARMGAHYIPGKYGKKGFISFYDVPKCRKEKLHIGMILKKSVDGTLLDCPLQVDLIFHMKRPELHYGTGKNRLTIKDKYLFATHTKTPDIDNLRKLIMDALTKVVWRDDSLVVKGTTIKKFSERPRVEIFIKCLE